MNNAGFLSPITPLSALGRKFAKDKLDMQKAASALNFIKYVIFTVIYCDIETDCSESA